MINGTESDYFKSNKDINGAEFIEFRVGDTVDFSEQIYTSNFFFTPVVDAPVVQIRNTEISDNTGSENVKFVGDNSTIYFELSSQGQNSEITRAELSIQQGHIVIYNTEFDEGNLVTDYTVNLGEIINTVNGGGISPVGHSVMYVPTESLEAKVTVQVEDKVAGSDAVDTGSFRLVEEVTVIPDPSQIKNDVGYRETLVGFLILIMRNQIFQNLVKVTILPYRPRVRFGSVFGRIP